MYQTQQLPPRERDISICKEILYTVPVSLYAKKNFFMFPAINEVLGHLLQAGLIEFWRLHDLDDNAINRKEIRQPEVIRMRDMQGGFRILVGGLIIGFILFSFENIFFKLVQCFKR